MIAKEINFPRTTRTQILSSLFYHQPGPWNTHTVNSLQISRFSPSICFGSVSLSVQRASTVSLCPRSLCVRQCAKVLRLYAPFFLEISDPPGRLLITTQLCYSAGLSPRTGQETIHQSRQYRNGNALTDILFVFYQTTWPCSFDHTNLRFLVCFSNERDGT